MLNDLRRKIKESDKEKEMAAKKHIFYTMCERRALKGTLNVENFNLAESWLIHDPTKSLKELKKMLDIPRD